MILPDQKSSYHDYAKPSLVQNKTWSDKGKGNHHADSITLYDLHDKC